MSALNEDWPGAECVALVSDTHGRLAPVVLASLAAARPDLIVHAGDIGGSAVVRELELLAPVCAVAGNNDDEAHWGDDAPAMRRALPSVRRIVLAGGTLAVIHGHQCASAARRHAWLRRRYPDARAVLYGHSHRRVIDEEDTPAVLNPGAAGRARAIGGAGWIGLRVSRSRWRFAVNGFARD